MKHLLFLMFSGTLLISACDSKPQTEGQNEEALNLKDIELSEALEMMQQSDIITIDIRTPEEIAQGKILESALEMDFYADDYKNKLSALDKEAKYVIYCRSGGRSGKTLKMMKDMGFKNAYNVLGGYNAYKEMKE